MAMLAKDNRWIQSQSKFQLEKGGSKRSEMTLQVEIMFDSNF